MNKEDEYLNMIDGLVKSFREAHKMLENMYETLYPDDGELNVILDDEMDLLQELEIYQVKLMEHKESYHSETFMKLSTRLHDLRARVLESQERLCPESK